MFLFVYTTQGCDFTAIDVYYVKNALLRNSVTGVEGILFEMAQYGGILIITATSLLEIL